jgi:MinD-like ATPase involved in chromosome partitioning or flagellar assembly
MIKEATQFVTFYSYKGGVGRTSALINSAVLRTLEGNNVVVIDFDLEAPGIAQYVRRIDSTYDEHRAGILEYLTDVVDGASSPSLLDQAVDLSDRLNGRNGGHLWLIGAGNTNDPQYTSRLEKLKWSEIFEKKFGEMMLQNLRNQIANEFDGPDYVFIDSRTGITEIGGVCTRYLADKLVILTSLNEQNINGTAMIYKEFRNERKECILVATNVPVGMPNGQNQLFSVRIDAFRDAFGRTPDLIVYHYPLLSLSEEVPALNLTRESDATRPTVALFETDPLLESYRKLSRVIGVPLPGRTSFDSLLSGAAHEVAYLPKATEMPNELLLLKEHFSDRYLAQVVLRAFWVLKDCFENANEPHDWKRDDYLALLEAESKITNRSTKEVIRVLRNNVFRLLRIYLSGTGKMHTSLEAFSDPKSIDNIVLKEISRCHYDWPLDFLRRRLETLSQDDHHTTAVMLYNLCHCLLKTANHAEAVLMLDRFLSEFKQIDMRVVEPETSANHYFCAALAYKELHFENDARIMRDKSLEQLSLISADGTVFSPIDYDLVPVQTLKSQLEAAFESHGEARRASTRVRYKIIK